jgi:CRP-like cAMP-binding protein
VDWKRGGGPKDPNQLQADVTRLKGLELFASLDDRVLEEVMQLSSWLVRQRGAEVQLSAQPADAAYIVVDGSVDLLHISPDGRVLRTVRLEAGEVVDFTPSLEADGRVIVAEVSSRTATVCMLPWSVFLRTVVANPHAAALFIEQQRYQRQEAEQLASELAFEPIATRVRHWLRRLAAQRGQNVVHCTLEELSRSAGTRPEEASRVIGDLQRRGLVRRRGRGRLEIPDPDELL